MYDAVVDAASAAVDVVVAVVVVGVVSQSVGDHTDSVGIDLGFAAGWLRCSCCYYYCCSCCTVAVAGTGSGRG